MSDEVRKISRRSFLGRVMGGAAVGTVAIVAGVAGVEPAEAQFTDNDLGRYADPVGRGRRGRPYTGISDRDPYDPYGRGRGRRRRYSGLTDRDPYDPVGNGRGYRRRRRRYSCTDRDVGPNYTDPIGRGRHC